MALFSLLRLLGTILLTSIPVLVSGAPTVYSSRQTQDYTWPQCITSATNYCTIYMATSDPDMDDYRTAVLFDYNCNVLQAIMVSKNTQHIELRGRLRLQFDLWVDSNAPPGGHVTYGGRFNIDYPLGQNMACYKPPNSDGTGCRMRILCV